MKYVIISDLHGKTIWWDIVLHYLTKYEHVFFIFMGDAVDEGKYVPLPSGGGHVVETITNMQILQNMINIDQFLRSYPDSVYIAGNHDTHYFQSNACICDGYRPTMKMDLYPIFNGWLRDGYMKLAFDFVDEAGTSWIVTHAGITYKWLDNVVGKGDNISYIDLSKKLNHLFYKDDRRIYMNGHLRGGSSPFSGPLMCDSGELIPTRANFNQIVGHTRQDHLIEYGSPMSDECLFLTDCIREDDLEFTLKNTLIL